MGTSNTAHVQQQLALDMMVRTMYAHTCTYSAVRIIILCCFVSRGSTEENKFLAKFHIFCHFSHYKN